MDSESNGNNGTEEVWLAMSCCAVCAKTMQISDGPLLLPCCHSACNACVADEQARIDESNTKENLIVVCKICGHEFKPSECVENLFHIHYMRTEKIKSNDNSDKLCQSCEGENKLAFIKCDKCDWICKECFDAHKKLKVFKDHILDDTTKIEETLDSSKPQISVCSIHNKREKMYCETCKSTYCRRCIVIDHKEHTHDESEVYAKQFSADITSLLTQIIEKRSLIETAMKELGEIESNINVQKETAIENIKSIQTKLEEKLIDMAKSLLEQVNSVCQKKEADYHEKKCQLIKLNDSFKHVEKFIDIILKQDIPIAIVMAKDLLKNQLLYLLNKPCTQPNFVKPFTIDVIDELSNDNMDFSCAKMVEGVFKICFKINTSDDPIISNGDSISVSNNNNDSDDVEIISADTIVTSITTNTNTVRGNSCIYNTPQNMLNNYPQNFPQNANYNTHRLHSQIPTQPQPQLQTRDNSRLHSSGGSITTAMHSINHLSHMTNNVSQIANNIPQTGIAQINSTMGTMNTANTVSYSGASMYAQRNPQTNNATYAPTMVNHSQTPQNTPYSRAQTYNIGMQPNLINRLAAPTVAAQTLQPQIQHVQQQTPYVQMMSGVAITPITSNGYIPQISSSPVYRPAQPPAYNNNNNLLRQQLNTQTNVTNRVDPRRASHTLLLAPQPIQPQQTPQVYQSTTTTPVVTPIVTLIATPVTTTCVITQSKAINSNNVIDNTSSLRPVLPKSNPKQTTQPIVVNVKTVTPPESLITNNKLPINNDNVINTNNHLKDNVIGTSKAVSNTDTQSSLTPLPPIIEKVSEKSVQSLPSMPTLANIIDSSLPKTTQTNEAINVSSDNSTDPNLRSQSVRENTSNASKDENKENKEQSSASARSTTPIARIAPITPEVDDSNDTTCDEMDSDEEPICSLCQGYGEIICCDSCPRAYHVDCHVPEIHETIASFVCTFCNVKLICSTNDNKEKQQQAIFERILIDLYCHKKSKFFHKTMPQEMITNNTTKIDTPMDFSIIKKKLKESRYMSEKQFVSDLKLIFDNFHKLTTCNEEMKANGRQVESHFNKLLEKFLPNINVLSRGRECTRQTSVSEPNSKKARYS